MKKLKILIDPNGILYIRRGGRLQVQICPYHPHKCSDSCPLFGEPDIAKRGGVEDKLLRICNNKTLDCEEILMPEREEWDSQHMCSGNKD